MTTEQHTELYRVSINFNTGEVSTRKFPTSKWQKVGFIAQHDTGIWMGRYLDSEEFTAGFLDGPYSHRWAAALAVVAAYENNETV